MLLHGSEIQDGTIPSSKLNFVPGGSPGGADKNIQFNNYGSFAGSNDFTWDNGNRSLFMGNINSPDNYYSNFGRSAFFGNQFIGIISYTSTFPNITATNCVIGASKFKASPPYYGNNSIFRGDNSVCLASYISKTPIYWDVGLIERSAFIATKDPWMNRNTKITNSAIIGGTNSGMSGSFSIAENCVWLGGNTIYISDEYVYNTVFMPRVRMGLGEFGYLPSLSSGYSSLGIDNTTGEVGTFAAPSDGRLKSIIGSLSYDESIGMIKSLNPVKFKWNLDMMPGNDNSELFGFIAQEVEEIREEMIHIAFERNGTKYMGIKENQFVPIIISAIKALDKRISFLENN